MNEEQRRKLRETIDADRQRRIAELKVKFKDQPVDKLVDAMVTIADQRAEMIYLFQTCHHISHNLGAAEAAVGVCVLSTFIADTICAPGEFELVRATIKDDAQRDTSLVRDVVDVILDIMASGAIDPTAAERDLH